MIVIRYTLQLLVAAATVVISAQAYDDFDAHDYGRVVISQYYRKGGLAYRHPAGNTLEQHRLYDENMLEAAYQRQHMDDQITKFFKDIEPFEKELHMYQVLALQQLGAVPEETEVDLIDRQIKVVWWYYRDCKIPYWRSLLEVLWRQKWLAEFGLPYWHRPSTGADQGQVLRFDDMVFQHLVGGPYEDNMYNTAYRVYMVEAAEQRQHINNAVTKFFKVITRNEQKLHRYQGEALQELGAVPQETEVTLIDRQIEVVTRSSRYYPWLKKYWYDSFLEVLQRQRLLAEVGLPYWHRRPSTVAHHGQVSLPVRSRDIGINSS